MRKTNSESTQNSIEHDFFISYPREEKKIAKYFYDKLSQYFRVYFDSKLRPGEDWQNALTENIKKSRAIIVVVSSNTIRSHYQKAEILIAKNAECDVIPITLGAKGLEVVKGHIELAPLQAIEIADESRNEALDDAVKQLVELHLNYRHTLSISRSVPVVQVYKELKESLLRLYERYKLLDISPEDEEIEQAINKIKQRKYTLAIAGEVKAGKSTFINALLGEAILPTDTLQNTSAIIEIFRQDRKSVQVRFGNGRRIVYEGDNIESLLAEIAVVTERYRSIPFPKINEFLLKNRGRYSKKDLACLVSLLMDCSDVEEKELDRLVREYVEEHKALDKIAVEVQVGFPLKEELSEVRIVDTPGVNAVGGIEEITYGYLAEADAIAFVHSLDGPAENKSLRDFVELQATRKDKEVLFLVLTKSGGKHSIEIEAKIEDISRRLSTIIEPRRVTQVDSLYKIMADEIDSDSSNLPGLKEKYVLAREEAERLYQRHGVRYRGQLIIAHAKENLLSALERKLDGTKTDLKEILFRRSNFATIDEMLRQFASIAPLILIRDIASQIKTSYENFSRDYEDRVELLKNKKKRPGKFDETIKQREAEIAKFRAELKHFEKEVRGKYLLDKAEWSIKLQAIEDDFKKKLQKCRAKDEFKRECLNAFDEFEELVNELVSEIHLDFSQRMKEIGVSFKINRYTISTPEINVETLLQKAAEAAKEVKPKYSTEVLYKTQPVFVEEERRVGFGKKLINLFKTGSWSPTERFRVQTGEEKVVVGKRRVKAGEKKRVNQEKYRESAIKELNKSITHTTSSLSEEVKSCIDKYCVSFDMKLTMHLEKQRKILSETKLKNKEEVDEEIEFLVKKRFLADEELKLVNEFINVANISC